MEKVVFELLSKEELSQISGGAVNFKNYPKPWYASGNTPPSGYYDLWDLYQPYKYNPYH
ncbi:bacteriocin [Streptococcus ferus]|uniref:bacteriocin n=1 Tax=Streptococcus ferus TaxID=1345 RepID=UPI0035A152F1